MKKVIPTLINSTTLQWPNGDTLEWTGFRFWYNGEDLKEPESQKEPKAIIGKQCETHRNWLGGCGCKNFENQVCDICQGIKGDERDVEEERGYQRRCVGCDRVFYVTDDVPAACPDYPGCTPGLLPSKKGLYPQPQEKEECKHKASATVDDYFMCRECGVCYYTKPQPKQEQIKPSQWINKRTEELIEDISKEYLPADPEYVRRWAKHSSILDFLDEHFSK